MKSTVSFITILSLIFIWIFWLLSKASINTFIQFSSIYFLGLFVGTIFGLFWGGTEQQKKLEKEWEKRNYERSN